MKRFFTIMLSALCAVFVISSCGDLEVKPAKVAISGPLGQYFKVVDRTYKIKNGTINIELERTNDGLPAPWVEGMEVGYRDNAVEPCLTIEYLDKDGDVVCTDNTSIVYENDQLVALVALAVGESSTIPFSANGKKIVMFRLSSTFEYHEPETKTEDVSMSSSGSSSDDDSLWDDLEDEYIEAVKTVSEEVKDVYNEAAGEVKSAMKDAIRDLL